MADDLNVILKAQLDVNQTAKQVNIQLGQIEEKIKALGIDIDMDGVFKSFNTSFGKVKESVNQIAKSFGNIDIGDKFSKGFDELNARVKEVRANVDSLAKIKIGLGVDENGEGRVEKALLTYKNDMGQIVNETMEWKNTFDSIGNITGQKFRSSFENISEDISKANKQADSFDDYINNARRSVQLLEEKITNLGTTKGLDVTKYTENITAMKAQLATLGQGGEASELEIQKKTFDSMLLSAKDLVNTDAQSLAITKQKNDLYASIDSKITKLNSIQNEYTGADTAKIKEAIGELNTLKTSIKNNSIAVDSAKVKNKELGNSINTISSSAKKASSATSTWASRLSRVFQFTLFYRGISMVQQGIKEMISTVSDLDKSLVSLQKVTNLSGQSLTDFTRQAYELGSQISKSGKSVIEASTEFAKAGYSEDELLRLSKSALVLTSIGDGINSSSEAASTIIAVMKGFGKSTEDVSMILDEINNVSNNSAVNFDDISFALQRMSGVMSASGVQLEESIGMFTAINEVLRSAEISSTSLNSISMRLRGLEEDGSAIAEDGFIPKLSSMFKDIAGIDMTDATGQVKSLFQITKELYPVWDTLTTNEKTYISQQAAGLRQSKAFLVMMNNYDRVLETTELAYNSAGSAMEEFSKWENSIEGKTNNLKSALEKFSTKTLNSQFIKSVIDMTTAIINFSTACGGAVPIVASLMVAFTTFKVLKLAGDLTKLTGITLKLATAFKALGTVATLGWAAGAIIAIMGIGAAINYVAGSADRAKEAVSILSTGLSDLQENSTTVDNLGKQFQSLKELTEQQRIANGTQQEFLDIQNQLKELLPDVNGFYDTQGNFIIDEKENVNSLTEALDKLIKKQREQLDTASDKSMGYTIQTYEAEKGRVELLKQYLEYAKKEATGTLESTDIEQVLFLQDYLSVDFDKTSIEQAIKDAGIVIENSLTDMQSNLRNKLMNSTEWDKLGEDTQNAILKAFSEVDDGNLAEFSESVDSGDMSVKALLHTLTNTQAFVDYIQSVEDAKDKTEGLEDAVTSLESKITALSGIRSNIEKLQGVLNNLDTGDLTASDMEELLGISAEFLPYLNDEIALREKLGQSITDYKNDYQNGYNAILNASDEFYTQKVKGDATLYNNLRNETARFFNDLGIDYTDDFDNYKNLEDAKVKLTTKILSQLAGGWADYFDAFTGQLKDTVDPRLGSGGTGGVFGKDNDFTKAYNDVKASQSKLDEIFNKIYKPVTFDFSDSKSSSASKAVEEELSEIEKLYEAFEKRIKDKEFQISLLDFNGGEDSTSKQIKIYEQMQAETHALAEKARKLDLVGNAEYIQDLQTQYIDYSNKILDLSSDAYDKANKNLADGTVQIELKQQLVKDDSQEYFDLEKQKYDNVLAQETLLQNEIARLQKIGTNQAKAEAESLIETYYDTVKERYSIIENMQSSQIAMYNEQIETLEKQKSAMEDLHDFTMQMIEAELKAKKESIQSDIDGIEKVFNAKKQALKDEQDSRSYDKGLTEKSSVVADLENQLAIIKNDETAIAKRKQLEQELTDAKADLADYQYDNSIALAEKALDEQLKIETDKLQEEVDLLDDTLSNEVTMRELANKRIEKSGQKLKDQLIKHAKEYGTFTIEEVSNAWEIAGSAVDDFNLKQLDLLDTLKLVADELKRVQSDLKIVESMNVGEYGSSNGLSTSTKLSASETKAKMMANSAKWIQSDTTTRGDLERDNQDLGNSMGWTYDSVKGQWFYDKQKKLPVYHDGGVVGGSGYATKSTEELAKLLKGELVITPPQADKVMDMITNNSNSNVTISMPIVIEGNADSDTVKALEKQMGKLADTVIDKLNTARNNTGFKKKPKFV